MNDMINVAKDDSIYNFLENWWNKLTENERLMYFNRSGYGNPQFSSYKWNDLPLLTQNWIANEKKLKLYK